MTDLIKRAPDQRSRWAHELRTALGEHTELWFSMVEPTFVAAGRVDGSATVIANSAGWQTVHHENEQPVIRPFPSAVDAVTAAKAVRA